jgi:four helix bundle protein
VTAGGLRSFGGYQKALMLFDLTVADMKELREVPECRRLVSQQIASVDSISSNIEEGYGRLSRAEFVRFLDFARGSARESQGRFLRLRHWLPEDRMKERAALAGEVIAILRASIERLRAEGSAARSVRESSDASEWCSSATLTPDT